MGLSHRRQSLLMALGAFFLALAGAAVLDAANSWISSRSELAAVARSIDLRSVKVRSEALDMARMLGDNASCDSRALRRLLSRSHYAHNLGRINGSRIYCDALDGPAADIDLGPPSVVRADGIRIWATGRALWAARGNSVVAIDPTSFVDALLPPDTIVAVLEAESGQMIVHSEPLPARVFQAAWRRGPGTWVQDGHLLSVSRSDDGRSLEIAARPLAAVRAAISDSLPRFLLAGAVFGLALGVAVNAAMGRRRTLVAELRRALRRHELRSALQPIVCFEAGRSRVVGFECLARWQLRGGPEISPTAFVPMIEDAGLGAELARCMTASIVEEFGATLKALPDLYVALNLSSEDISDPRVLDDIDRILAAGGVAPRQVVIELTERTFEASGLDIGLLRLRKAGHKVSIDDFGTGASNASRLATLHPDMVKIDRSFLLHAEGESPAASLLAQLVAMARSCGAQVVIEGAETPEQAARVQAFGDVCAQGYYWHRPLSPSQARILVLAQAASPSTLPVGEAALA